jgi:hypothetical protein
LAESQPKDVVEIQFPLYVSISFLVCHCKPFLPHLGSYPKIGNGIFSVYKEEITMAEGGKERELVSLK